MQPDNSLTRRVLLAGGSALAAAAADDKAASGKLKVAIFSKHLLFLKGDALAAGAAEIGFDGIDLAVRKGGHVEPDRVREDLPKLVASIRQHGLEVPMLTTDIADTESPYAEDILKSMSELGIRHYRWGGFKYETKRSLAQQLEDLKPRVAKLAALNSKYKACAMYHTHSGIGLVGASIWDLHIVLKDLDPQAVGVNYDVGHATIEGGFGGWINSFRITGPHLRGVAVKNAGRGAVLRAVAASLRVSARRGGWRQVDADHPARRGHRRDEAGLASVANLAEGSRVVAQADSLRRASARFAGRD